MKKFYNEVWHAFPDANFKLDRIVAEGSEAACMFSSVGTQKNEFMGVPPGDKQIKIDGMIFFRFRASKIVERWEIIDMVSAMKQLGARQQLAAVKNAILEYA
jgi:predicted ester cyclase